MSVPHPGGDPNANLYAQLKRDVLDRVPHITRVEYIWEIVEDLLEDVLPTYQ